MPDLLRAHFEQAANAGLLLNPDVDVAQVSAAWGDEVRLMANFSGPQIAELKWQAAGRPELIAAMSLASDYVLQNSAAKGLAAYLETQLELSGNQRYLLLLIEDAFAELFKNF